VSSRAHHVNRDIALVVALAAPVPHYRNGFHLNEESALVDNAIALSDITTVYYDDRLRGPRIVV
jgi:hypothetical protein